jgi:hypothetical protein
MPPRYVLRHPYPSRRPATPDRRISGGLISKHITVPVNVLAGDDDAGLVGVLAGRHGGIDRHDDPHQARDVSMDWPARLGTGLEHPDALLRNWRGEFAA